MVKKLFILTACFLFVQCQSPKLTTPLTFDQHIQTGKLDNGLRYFIAENKEPKDRVYIRLVVNAGSMNEEDDQKGIAHLVEHMAFNGTAQFPKNQIITELEQLGMKFAQDINAFTDFENTVYTLNLAKNDLKTLSSALNIVEQWINHLTILPDDLDAERGIVIEEWRARLSPILRLANKKSEIEMAGSRYVLRDPIGDVDIIQHIPRQRVIDFYRKWYRPDNISVIIVGDIDKYNVKTLLENKLSSLYSPNAPLENIDFSIPLSNQFKVETISEPGINNATIELSFLQAATPQQTFAEYKQDLIRQIAIRLTNLRLQQWEKAQHIESANFYHTYLGKETLRTTFSLQLIKPEYHQYIENIFKFIAEISQNGFSKTELKKEINHLLQLNEKQLNKEITSLSLAEDLVIAAANNQIILSPKDKYALILSQITLTDINQAFNEIIQLDSKLLLITQPDADHKAIFNQSDIQTMWNSILNEPQPRWLEKDRAIAIPNISLKKGKIINKKVWQDLGITEYHLSNGKKLIYYYSNKMPNQIYFKAITKGGLRAIPNNEYHLLKTATKLIDDTGIGYLSAEDIGYLFAQDPIIFSTLLDDYYQGFVAKGQTKERHNIMKLFHLKLSEPYISEQILNNFKQETNDYFKYMDKETEFTRHVFTLRYPNNEHIYSQTKKSLSNINIEQLKNIYQQYIINNRDFTYFIIGDISPSDVEEIAETYLASLKVTEKNMHKYQMVKASTPPPFQMKGIKESRAEVEIYLTQEAPWLAENDYLLDILGDILQEKLRLILREEYSGIYSVNSWFSQEPQTSQLDGKIAFSCAPEKVEQLIKLTYQILDDMIQNGIDSHLFVKKLAEKQMQLKLQADNLLVIFDLIERSYRNFDSPVLLSLPKQLDKLVTKEKVEQLAKMLLKPSNRFQAILLP